MRSFIYDQYGYITDGEQNEFSYKGYDFKLVAHDKTEEEVMELEKLLDSIKSQLPYEVKAYIVKSRNHTLVTENEFGPVSLIAAKHQEYTPYAVITFNQLFNNKIGNYDFKVSDLIELWEEKMALIEERYTADFNIDDYAYPILHTETIFALGMACNAISYLVDIKYDYGDSITNLSLVHRRIENLYGIELFNPFNFVVDSFGRDLTFLYKIGEINEDELVNVISKLNLSPMDVSLLFARLLFPTKTFDLLEDQYSIKKDIRKDLMEEFNNSTKSIKRFSKIMSKIVENSFVRKIDWLI